MIYNLDIIRSAPDETPISAHMVAAIVRVAEDTVDEVSTSYNFLSTSLTLQGQCYKQFRAVNYCQ
jgi:hypothetical protein